MNFKNIIIATVLSATHSLLLAQLDFKILDRDVQVHSFASQGFLYSNNNNYLTMPTSQGSFAMTEGGVNISMPVTDKLRIGAQVYDRNIGALSNWTPTLDWATVDYRFKDWLGIRGGKVKTVLGLFNDTQDMEFLHTWALMPQGVYPTDLRGESIAHDGADLYGTLRIKKLGSFAYTVYGGKRPADLHGGFIYGIDNNKTHVSSMPGTEEGADVRWTTPVKGLLVGAAVLWQDPTTRGTNTYATTAGLVATPYTKYTLKDHTTGFYTEYTWKNLTFDGEYRRQWRSTENIQSGSATALPKNSFNTYDARFGYVALAYRVNRWMEVGSYESRYVADWRVYHANPANHLFDQAITARFDLRNYLDVKIEGHFMDGNGGAKTDRGFYPVNNPSGFVDSTHLLVIRLEYHL